MPTTQPRPFDHLGLTVPDIERAVDFYTGVLGFRLLMGPTEFPADDSPLGAIGRDVLGPRFGGARIAHLAAANDVGLELFEFREPPTRKPADGFRYEEVGPFHFNVVDPDIDGLVQRVEAAGGRRRSETHPFDPELPFRMVYMEDPFGNVFECYTHPYVQLYSTLAARQEQTAA